MSRYRGPNNSWHGANRGPGYDYTPNTYYPDHVRTEEEEEADERAAAFASAAAEQPATQRTVQKLKPLPPLSPLPAESKFKPAF
jgi:hypothetical protein